MFTMQEAGPHELQQRDIKALTVTISLVDSANESTTMCELDSHADTCVAGSNFYFVGGDGRTVNVSPFTKSINSIADVPIGTVATLYHHPATGVEYLLIFHEALFLGSKLKGPSLLCPNQM